jgi:hypothetical protein
MGPPELAREPSPVDASPNPAPAREEVPHAVKLTAAASAVAAVTPVIHEPFIFGMATLRQLSRLSQRAMVEPSL